MNRPRIFRNSRITLFHSLLLTYRWTRHWDRFNGDMRSRHEMWIIIPRRILAHPGSSLLFIWMKNPTFGWSWRVLRCIGLGAPSSCFGIGDGEYNIFVIAFVPVRCWATLIYKCRERLWVFLLDDNPNMRSSHATSKVYVSVGALTEDRDVCVWIYETDDGVYRAQDLNNKCQSSEGIWYLPAMTVLVFTLVTAEKLPGMSARNELSTALTSSCKWVPLKAFLALTVRKTSAQDRLGRRKVFATSHWPHQLLKVSLIKSRYSPGREAMHSTAWQVNICLSTIRTNEFHTLPWGLASDNHFYLNPS